MQCKRCGKQIPEHFAPLMLCTNCWEVEGRIEEYLQSEEGRKYIEKLLFKLTKKELI
jgi:hypothetical protein